jgi:hypothetical protein
MTNNTKIKTTNISCRIEKLIYAKLFLEAKQQGISVNSLVSSIFRHHITWQKFSDELGLVPMTKSLLEIIFEQLDDKTIESMVKKCGLVIPKGLLYLSGNSMNFENMMEALEINAKRFGLVKHTNQDGVHNFNIHHGISRNFSQFLGAVHQKLADDLSYKLEICNLDKNMLCMHFSEPKLNS